jgi:phosphatidate cytidylyltransferase
MSPSAALHDPAFRLFAIIIAATLLATGVILLLLKQFLRKNTSRLWTIWRGWVVMAPIALGALFAGRIPFIAGAALVAVWAFKEYARATGLYRDWPLTLAAYLAIAGAAVTAGLPDYDRPPGQRPGWFDLFEAVPVYAVCLFLVIPVLRNRAQGQLQQIALAIVGFVLIGFMFQHLGFLTNAPRPYGPICFIVFATAVTDVAAYTFGTLLGKSGRHPLRSQISPNKTWEGALGALAVGMALPWLLEFALPAQFGPGHKIVAGLIVGAGGQLGDLAISLIKRDVGVKDMGASIPGHGGILDRIDSLLFTAPLFLRLIHFVEPLR